MREMALVIPIFVFGDVLPRARRLIDNNTIAIRRAWPYRDMQMQVAERPFGGGENGVGANPNGEIGFLYDVSRGGKLRGRWPEKSVRARTANRAAIRFLPNGRAP